MRNSYQRWNYLKVLIIFYQDMDPYEKLQIADALKVDKFKAGDYIIK